MDLGHKVSRPKPIPGLCSMKNYEVCQEFIYPSDIDQAWKLWCNSAEEDLIRFWDVPIGSLHRGQVPTLVPIRRQNTIDTCRITAYAPMASNVSWIYNKGR